MERKRGARAAAVLCAHRASRNIGRMRTLQHLLLAGALVSLPACENLNFYSDEQLEPLSAEAYAQASQENPPITSGRDYEMVQRVAQRIAAAADEPGFNWEARLLKADDVPNAFCLPNGRIAIYTGILPITQNENGLAVVMGHEVAHAVLRHGGKRMTSANLTEAAMAALDAGLGMSDMSPESRSGVMAAIGMGASVGITLPFSRGHETEADVEGLRYAIRAGYDANEAPKLWERMAQRGGSGGPVWLSTHPASLDRAQKLREMIPILVEQEKGWRPRAGAPAAR